MGKALKTAAIIITTVLATFAFANTAGALSSACDPSYDCIGPATSTATTVKPNNPKDVNVEVHSNRGEQAVAQPGVQPEVKANADKLAWTGSDSTKLALIGAVAVLAGGSLLMIRRRSAA